VLPSARRPISIQRNRRPNPAALQALLGGRGCGRRAPDIIADMTKRPLRKSRGCNRPLASLTEARRAPSGALVGHARAARWPAPLN
jgi:hypothetical protein